MLKIIFLVLISSSTLFMCYGQVTPVLKPPRPINLFIINDIENKEANKSVANTLKEIKKNDPNLLKNVIVVEINGSDPSIALSKICTSWQNAIKNSSGSPDLVLDTTRSGFSGEVVRIFTAAVGVPTFSSQFGEKNDLTHWQEFPKNQDNYLIQIKPPADLIPNAIRLLITQMNIKDAVVIFDDNFVMDTRYKTLLADVLERYVILKAKSSEKEIIQQLDRLRKLDFFNFFIMGQKETIMKQVQVAVSRHSFTKFYNWYTFSLDHEIFQTSNDSKEIEINNENPPILQFAPIASSQNKNRMQALINTKVLTKSRIMSAFYHDFVKIGIEAMRLAVKDNIWPLEPYHITCEEFNGNNTPTRKFDLLSKLKEVTLNFEETFAGFEWGKANGDHHAKFNMDIAYTAIHKNKQFLVQNLGFWPAGINKLNLQSNSLEKINSYKAPINYRIVVVINPPFVEYNNVTKEWSGYCIDMLNEIQKILNFTYTIYESPDKTYGMLSTKNLSSSWDGMVEQLIKKNADIALGAFSIMAERDRVIDFTIPFYKHVGISILMLKPKAKTSLFKFLTVLETNVWLCILASYFFTSILMWIFDKYSPYSYQNNKEKYKDDDEKRIFDLKECLWFCMTSLTPQGGGEAPKNLSGRLVAATWWLFGFIIIASYTANLAAFLTVSRLETPIESLDGLSKQYKVQYAPTLDSEAYTYFKRMSDIEQKFYEIWKDMSLNDSLSEIERAKLAVWDYPVSDKYTKIFEAMTEAGFPLNREDALARVRSHTQDKDGSTEFAWVGDAAEIKYLTMTSCDIIMVGEEFSKKPYGIGVQEGSPLRDQLNDAIIELQHEKIFDNLEKKWWDNNPRKEICPKIPDQSDGISIENIGGVFIVICVGIILACITLSIEYWIYNRKQIRPSRKSQLKPKIAWSNVNPRRFNVTKPSDLTVKTDVNCQSRY